MDMNIANKLRTKIERLELAVQRGMVFADNPELQHCSGKIISPEQCLWTLKDCALFKKWINECFESCESTVALSSHDLEQ